jgi:hypothetical protein
MPKKSGKSTAARSSVKTVATPTKPRRVKPGKYQSLRLQKRIKHPITLPNVWWITKETALLLWRYKRLFVGITLMYGFLNVILAQGLSGGTDVTTLKDAFNEVFTGNFRFVSTSLSIFAVLISTAGNTTSQAAGAYQIFLAIICSLAIIWALRQVVAGSRPRIRDTFYRGMSPLVPFILVLFVIGLQLVPLFIGSGLYSLVINNGIAIYTVEKIIWALLFGVLALLSLYMLSSSLFALYIVTLPDMTPLKALRSARALVRYRRWTVLRKLLCLPVILLVVAAVIMLPIIIFLTPLARWIFFLLTMFSLTVIHAYIYTLYRELLHE